MSELEILIDGFIADLVRRNWSAHSIRAYRADLLSFRDSFPPSLPVALTTVIDIRVWLASLWEKQLSISTIRRHIASCRAFFQFIKREGLIPQNPAKLVRVPKMPQRLPDVLTPQQTGTLIDNVEAMEQRQPVRDLAIFELLYGCGIRVSELVGLNVEDIDRAEGWLLIRGKGKKERQVPYGSKAREALERYLAFRTEYLKPGYRKPSRRYDRSDRKKKERQVPYGDKAKEVLEHYLSFRADPLKPAVFLSRYRERLTTRQVGNIVNEYATRIPEDAALHPHGLRDLAIIELLSSCGLHRSELAALNIGDIDREGCRLLVRGKAEKERQRQKVQGQSLGAGPLQPAVFLSQFRKRLTTRQVGNIIKKYGAMVLGDPSIHPHTFRHASA